MCMLWLCTLEGKLQKVGREGCTTCLGGVPEGPEMSSESGWSMPNMTGRPGHRTMEMNGGSSAPHLARTPCVPLFVHCLLRVEAEGLLDYQGRAGIISIVRWNLRPVIFGVELAPVQHCIAGLVPPHVCAPSLDHWSACPWV